MLRTFILAIASCILHSCIPDPVPPEGGGGVALRDGGMWVLCEGLWRQNNSMLAYVQPDMSVVDVMRAANSAERLGDTPTDIAIKGDTIFVALNGSRSIDVFNRVTGKRIARIRIDDRKEPYRLALSNDSTLYCTNLNDDSMTELDARTFAVRLATIPTGPAPEGVAVTRTHVYVAASGLGDLRKNEEGAGTLCVYRRSDMLLERRIGPLPNIADVSIDAARDRLWVTYRNFSSMPDSLGGLVLYNLTTLAELRRWRVHAPRDIALDATSGAVYLLHRDGVDRADGTDLKNVVSHRSDNASVWYSLGYNSRTMQLFVGDAKGYVTAGDVIVFSSLGRELSRFRVGINPTAFAFQ